MKLAAKTPLTKAGPKLRARKQNGGVWELRLYIAGQTPNSITAVTNLKRICEERLQGRYRIEVIDLLANPQLAKGDQIIAIPTLVRRLPAPVKRVVGNLSRSERAVVGLDLQPGAAHS
ncbi:MAG TPA: circadian clock KaiB family protein [Bryobacteraceae bacterium]|jgi:circadian clock protein KaiB